jgi:RHS repeat-associated protein
MASNLTKECYQKVGGEGFGYDSLLVTAATLVDAAGNVVETYEYDPYGRVSVYVGSSATAVSASAYGLPFLWKSVRLDEITGLLQMRNRYYSVELGRFLTRDPLGVWGDGLNGGNEYGYVGNRPLSRGDRYGLQTDEELKKWAEESAETDVLPQDREEYKELIIANRKALKRYQSALEEECAAKRQWAEWEKSKAGELLRFIVSCGDPDPTSGNGGGKNLDRARPVPSGRPKVPESLHDALGDYVTDKLKPDLPGFWDELHRVLQAQKFAAMRLYRDAKKRREQLGASIDSLDKRIAELRARNK